MNYSDPDSVPAIWQVGDVILDLYEVRKVTEGFGEDAHEKDYHEGGFGRVYKVWHRTWRRDMAVKSPRPGLFTTQKQKDMFTRECETWANLGLHGHIAACHYVRDLGGAPRVFSEYAAAGTLEEWIHSRRLYEGGGKVALQRMLDVAIQFAWGLHYAHERGVIHQDVKPLNALMWNDGTLKVSDFGLAGALQKAGIADAGEDLDGMTMRVAGGGGMTLAYCSPEQYSREKLLTRRTDVWSWGLSVLAIFEGGTNWGQKGIPTGTLAARILEAFLEHNGEEEDIPPMPNGMATLLRRCFQKEPDDRPRTLRDCAAALCEVYQTETGKPYLRIEPKAVGDTADALNNRALSFLDLGKSDEAERLFEQALALDKHHVAATYNRGLMRWRVGKSTDADGLGSLEEIEKEHPEGASLECAIGWVRMESADFAQAMAHFEKAIQFGDDSEARRGLEQARPLAQAGAGQCLRIFEGHTSFVGSVAYSPDGRTALSGSSDKTLRLWDVATGKCLRTFEGHNFEGHSDGVNSVAFSPDGRFAFSGGDWTLRLWDVATGKCLRIFEGHTDSVTSVVYLPDGRFALSGSGDETLRLWDMVTGKCLRTFEGHTNSVMSVAYSPNGRFALSGSDDKTLRLWDVTTGQCLRTFEGHQGTVLSVAFSPDGRFALSGSSLRLWDVATGRCLRIFAEGANSISYSPDGRFVLSGSSDKTLRLWDVVAGQCLRTFEGHTNSVMSVAYSPDGRFVLSGSWDETLRLWDVSSVMDRRYVAPWFYGMVSTVDEALKRQDSHEALLSLTREALGAGKIAEALAVLKQARAVPGFERNPESLELQARAGARARVKSYSAGWLKHTFWGHTDPVTSVSISPDGRFALSGSHDTTLRLWDVATGKCLRTFEGHTNFVFSVAYSPDGRFALSGSHDRTLRLWDMATGKCLRTFEGHTSLVYSVAYSPDGRFALSGSEDKTLRLWDVTTGRCLRTFEGHTKWVKSVAYSPDGRFALSGSDDGTLRLWEVAMGQCLRTFLEEDWDAVYSVAYSPDGRFALSSGGYDETLRLWDVITGKCLRIFEGNTEMVNSVAFSSDGRFALSGSYDRTLRLWEVATGKCLRTFEGHTYEITSVAFSPNFRFALSGSNDATLRLWEFDWEYEYDPEHAPVLKRRAEEASNRSLHGRIANLFTGRKGKK